MSNTISVPFSPPSEEEETDTSNAISPPYSWFLKYWYKFSNKSLMLLANSSAIRAEDGPAFLFSTCFPASALDTDFARRFSLVPWMTYRQWSQDGIDGFYTDCGWGCMLRTAQMMLAEALFRMENGNLGSSAMPRALREGVLQRFIDTPSAPYSLHAMLKCAKRFGKRAGQWFEPTPTLLVIAELVQAQYAGRVRALVARDSVLDASSLVRPSKEEGDEDEDFDPLLNGSRGSGSQGRNPVLLFVPLRLGMRHFNVESYARALSEVLRLPQSIGSIGGKPGRSLYFCGTQRDKLIYLDPHTVQDTLPFNAQTFQCHEAHVMPISEVDPTLALGFLVYSYKDFLDLKSRVEALPGPAMFSIITEPPRSAHFATTNGNSTAAAGVDDFEGWDEEEFEQVLPPASSTQGETLNDDEEFTQVPSPASPVLVSMPAPPTPPPKQQQREEEFEVL